MRQILGMFGAKPAPAPSGEEADKMLEASLEALSAEGEKGLAPARVAARAGLGLAALRNYFPNKDAIVKALIEREMAGIHATMKAVLEESHNLSGAGVVRKLINALLQRLGGGGGPRRALTILFMRHADSGVMMQSVAELTAKIFAELRWHDDFPHDMTAMRFHVLTRSVMGAVRLTALEKPDMLNDPAFEDEVVWMVTSFALLTTPEQRARLDPAK